MILTMNEQLIKNNLFLEDDYRALADKIKTIEDTIREIEEGVGFSTSQSSETWHDNIMHEELMRTFAMWSYNRDELRTIYKQAEVIESSSSTKVVGVGSRVRLADLVSRKELTYEIGSYYMANESSARISYRSPLATLLLGERLGSIVEGTVGPNERRLQINEIQPI